MKQNIEVMKQKFPFIWTLVSAAVETAIEIKEKKKAVAYINNGFMFSYVAFHLPKLAAESVEFEKDPANKETLRLAINEQFENKDGGLVALVFEIVMPLIFMNIGGGFALERAIKDFENKEHF